MCTYLKECEFRLADGTCIKHAQVCLKKNLHFILKKEKVSINLEKKISMYILLVTLKTNTVASLNQYYCCVSIITLFERPIRQ